MLCLQGLPYLTDLRSCLYECCCAISHWSLSYCDPRWDQLWPLTLLLFIPGWNSEQFAAMWGTAVHPQAEGTHLCLLSSWESFPTSTPLQFSSHLQETCTSHCQGRKQVLCWSHLQVWCFKVRAASNTKWWRRRPGENPSASYSV